MGRFRTAWLIAPLLLLLALPQAGAVDVSARLQAARVEAAAGHLAGDFVASSWTRDEPGDLPGLAITAAQAVVIVDRALREAQWQDGPLGPLSLRPTAESRDGPRTYTGLVLGNAAAVSPARVLLLPATDPAGGARAAVDGGLAVVPGGGADVVEPRLAAPSAPDFRLPVAASFEVRLAGPLLHVTGDVRVVVTGLDLAFTSDQGDVALSTGMRDESAVGPDANPLRRQESREAVLDLRGADLRLPADRAWFLAATLEAQDVVLEGAQGTFRWLGGEQEVDRVDIVASGRPRLSVARSPHATLAAEFDGPVSSLAVDGTALALEEPGRPGPPLAGGLLLGALAILAIAVHVLRGLVRFRAVDRALGNQRYADALALSGRFRLHPWHRQDAALAAALSLTELGRPAEARASLLAGAGWAPARQATRDFLLARAAARLGDQAEAVRRLAASLLADPGLLPQAKADAALAPVVRPWVAMAEGAGAGEARGAASGSTSASEAYA